MSMEMVIFLLLALAGGTHAFSPAAEIKCNATLNTSLCSVTQGGSVYIQVMSSARGYRLLCKKELPTGSIKVFSVKKGNVTIQGELKARAEFFIHNGTFKIRDVERSDSGQYSVEVFDEDGRQLRVIPIQLDVKENTSYLMIIVCSAVGALLIVVIFCCVCCKVRRNKKSGSGKL